MKCRKEMESEFKSRVLNYLSKGNGREAEMGMRRGLKDYKFIHFFHFIFHFTNFTTFRKAIIINHF